MWRVRWHELGRVRRKFFTGREAADAHAAYVRGEPVGVRQRFLAMAPHAQEQMLSVWGEAERRGIDLFTLLSKQVEPTTKSATLAAVIDELLAIKRASGRSERYLIVLELILRHFAAGREKLPIAAVTLEEIERHLNTKKIASRQCIRGRISTLMRFAIRRGYCDKNPCDRLEPITLTHKVPAILTVHQVSEGLKWFKNNPRSLAWFILSTFAGLRPEEADRTSWREINFTEGWIRVEAQTTKVRQRRVVYPKPMALKWLKLAKKLKSSLPIYRVTRIWDLKRLRGPLKLKRWPQDCTRHTCASMWLAECGSAATVATALGHSESVLRKHYMALVTKTDAAKFWSL